jgi:hypothetical protein
MRDVPLGDQRVELARAVRAGLVRRDRARVRDTTTARVMVRVRARVRARLWFGDGSVMDRLTTRRSTTLTGGGGSVARSTPCFLALAICWLYSSTTLRFWLASLHLESG